MERFIDTIIFDLGGVLIDWNPRYVYRTIFQTEDEADYFLENITTHEWNEEQDGGRSLKDATEWLLARHPKYELEIKAYYDRWEEMLGGAIEDTVSILRALHSTNNNRLLALTNWSAETFPRAQELYEFLHLFEGIVVSGIEKMKKPDPAIYKLISERYNLDPAKSLFIDDNLRNIHAAEEFGFQVHHFTSAQVLQEHLQTLGLSTGFNTV